MLRQQRGRPWVFRPIENHSLLNAEPVSEEARCRLCPECEQVLFSPKEVVVRGIRTDWARHKSSFRDLQASANRGCVFCSILLDITAKTLAENGHDAGAIVKRNSAPDLKKVPIGISFSDIFVDTEFRGDYDLIEYAPRLVFEGQTGTLCHFIIRLSLLTGINKSISSRIVSECPSLLRCKAWIETCHTDHAKCCKTGMEDQDLPTRLIDVGPPDSPQSVKLKRTRGQRGRYITLSHRWGDPKPPTTTTTNIEEREQGILLESLPATFRDAIQITRILGFRYLWIDSLCIVQNDSQDWQQEWPRMVSVYMNSAVTIAGLKCSSHEDGLLPHRKLPSVSTNRSFRIRSRDGTVDCALQLERSSFTNHDHAPNILSRAWTLQERLLSPRNIYFGDGEMYFECNTVRAREALISTACSVPVEFGIRKDVLSIPEEDLYRHWPMVVEEYSHRFLTYWDDRLPALSGLANAVKGRLQDDYLAGLWRKTLVFDLSWRRNSAQPCSSDAPAIASPTWSWVVCNYGTTYWLYHPTDDGYTTMISVHDFTIVKQCLEILDVRLNLKGDNPFGQIIDGKLLIRGKTIEVYIDRDSRGSSELAVHSGKFQRDKIVFAVMDEPALETKSGHSVSQRPAVEQDRDEDFRGTKKIMRVLVSSGLKYRNMPGLERWVALWTGLALEKVSTTSSTGDEEFRRLGLIYCFDFHPSTDEKNPPNEVMNIDACFDDAEERTIMIV